MFYTVVLEISVTKPLLSQRGCGVVTRIGLRVAHLGGISCNVISDFVTLRIRLRWICPCPRHEGTQRSQRYSDTHSLPGHYMEVSDPIRAPAALAAGMNVPTYTAGSWWLHSSPGRS